MSKAATDLRTRMTGFDPYDALAGARMPAWIHSRPRTRQIAIQVRKRCPLDLAPLFGIQPRLIAKALGCFLATEARLAAAEEDRNPAHVGHALELVSLMDASKGNCGGGSWGYEFDVQTRWAYYAAATPNLIATVFVGRALAEAGVSFAAPDLSERGRQAAAYLATSLLRQTDKGQPFFAYIPDSSRLIHNANLLGAGFVAVAGALHGVPAWSRLALEAAATSVAAQRADGSWPYGEGQDLGWSDNFHTAYNLDGLLLLWLATEDPQVRAALDQGTAHWSRDFFGPSGEPKYYPGKPLPYDIHGAATAVDLAARLATWGFPTAELAGLVTQWTGANLVDPRTCLTYFQKHRFFTDRRNFIRWGEAHWALAGASLDLLASETRCPLEARVEAMGRAAREHGSTRSTLGPQGEGTDAV